MRHPSAFFAIGRVVVAGALAGCAHQPPSAQRIEVQVKADACDWAGPLACEASNAAGRWAFSAPGAVTVVPSSSPLQISCAAPSGSATEPSLTSPSAAPSRDRAREGAATGTKVGAGAGVALGAAALPVMGGPAAVLMAVGAALRGRQIGGLVGAMRSGDTIHYPSPVILHLKSEPTSVDSLAAPARTAP